MYSRCSIELATIFQTIRNKARSQSRYQIRISEWDPFIRKSLFFCPVEISDTSHALAGAPNRPAIAPRPRKMAGLRLALRIDPGYLLTTCPHSSNRGTTPSRLNPDGHPKLVNGRFRICNSNSSLTQWGAEQLGYSSGQTGRMAAVWIRDCPCSGCQGHST